MNATPFLDMTTIADSKGLLIRVRYPLSSNDSGSISNGGSNNSNSNGNNSSPDFSPRKANVSRESSNEGTDSRNIWKTTDIEDDIDAPPQRLEVFTKPLKDVLTALSIDARYSSRIVSRITMSHSLFHYYELLT